MLDLIKRNAVPAAVIRSAARGALSIPASEMFEILVYLTHHPVFGQEAKLTLAGWDESSARTVLCSSAAPQEVCGWKDRALNAHPLEVRNVLIDANAAARRCARTRRQEDHFHTAASPRSVAMAPCRYSSSKRPPAFIPGGRLAGQLAHRRLL